MRIFLLVLGVLGVLLPSLAQASDDDIRALVVPSGFEKYSATRDTISEMAATGEPSAIPILEALGDKRLVIRESDQQIFIAKEKAGGYDLLDIISLEKVGEAASGEVDDIRVNNSVRRSIRSALGTLQLSSARVSDRKTAAESLFTGGSEDDIPLLETALEKETNKGVRRIMASAKAAIVLKEGADDAAMLEAVEVLKQRGDQEALSVLLSGQEAAESDALKAAYAQAIKAVEKRLGLWAAVQNVWSGLSLGSVLFLAAIGLAITFGVMGVINMAHGEMVMLGAYTTFVVQEVIRNSFPGLFDYSLFIALPLAFLVAGAVGIVIEQTIIQRLYGRPLETLLATWGLSLILQQAVRSIFGPTNREVGNPSWMSGSFDLGGLAITYNRMWIVVFAILVFVALLTALRKTDFGLQMRAVVQNRAMAGSLGIRTRTVDALTFGLGSGIAGIAGVALSQIDNVSPNLGQGYIIDSFLVVVFGGVGNLWGTLVGAMTLGVANKFLEPYAGAVLAKIFVLVLIILFIQRRPRGLFALRGRAAEG